MLCSLSGIVQKTGLVLPKKLHVVRASNYFLWKKIKFCTDLQLRPEGETPLQWITKECLLADAGVKLRKWQGLVEASDMQMKERVFRYFTMPVA